MKKQLKKCKQLGIGFLWCKNRNRKKQSNRTPGMMKSESCKASNKDKFFAKRSKAYKHSEYGAWLKATRIK